MNIALLIAGEFREHKLARSFWEYQKYGTIDTFFSTWDISYYNNPVTDEKFFESINFQDIGNVDRDYINIERLPSNNAAWPTALYLYKIKDVIKLFYKNLKKQYDLIIITRPDLVYKVFDNIDFKNHLKFCNEFKTIYGITNNGDISQKLASDVLMVMTQESLLEFYNCLPEQNLTTLLTSSNKIFDIHKYLGELLYFNNFKVKNLPVSNWTIVRSVSRYKKNLSFSDICNDAKDYWEHKYKKFFGSTENFYFAKETVKIEEVHSKSLNLYDKFDLNVWNESGKSFKFHSVDNISNFERIKDEVITYGPDDITYNYDNFGFRVPDNNLNDFSRINEYPTFLFSGCSHTEGIGLPEHHIYHSFLIDKFNDFNFSKKPIAKINLGKGGRSIDAIIRYTYVFLEKFNVTPHFIYFLLPPICRKEIVIDNDNEPFIFHYSFNNNIPNYFSEEIKQFLKNQNNEVTVRNCYHNCFSKLMFIKYYLEKKNIPWFFSFWNDDLNVENIKLLIPSYEKEDGVLPYVLQNHYIDINFHKEHKHFIKKFKYEIARDGIHYGPNVHYYFAEELFKKLLQSNIFK